MSANVIPTVRRPNKEHATRTRPAAAGRPARGGRLIKWSPTGRELLVQPQAAPAWDHALADLLPAPHLLRPISVVHVVGVVQTGPLLNLGHYGTALDAVPVLGPHHISITIIKFILIIFERVTVSADARGTRPNARV